MRQRTNLRRMWVLPGLLTLLAAPGADAAEALLARDGRAEMEVVIATNAGAPVRQAAAELAQYLGQMTGAEFKVTTDAGGTGDSGIVLGTREQFAKLVTAEIDEALALRRGFDGVEAFVIRTEPKRVLLLGRTELGASHAAYRLLEELGCRWFFPSDAWTVVPRRPTIRIDLNLADRPVILSRRIWYGWGLFPSEGNRSREDYAAWSRRNRMAMSIHTNCGHAWQNVIAAHKAVFEAHPEYLALTKQDDGSMRRGGEKFCVSNDDLRQLVVQYVLNQFEKNPSLDMVSVDPSDGGGHCECEACGKMGNGSVSDRVFLLANQCAKAVAEKFPGRYVGLYAYNLHSEPPSFDLEPNVYVELTAGFIRGQYTWEQLLDLWPRRAASMGFYEYFSVYLWDWDMPPGGRAADVALLKQRMVNYARRNAVSLSAESGNNWGLHGRGYYVANRLMWNPDADVEALLTDFYANAFGPAAAPMRRYYERMDPGSKPLVGVQLLGMAYRDIAEATRLAADRPDVLARLDQLKCFLRYVHLRWQMDREPDEARKKALALETLTHVYRTRFMYMNHWEAIRQSQTRRWAEQFKEPSWSFRQREQPYPWQVDEFYTTEQIAGFFAEGLSYFGTRDITERTFSSDLVPAPFGEPGKPDAPKITTSAFQGGFELTIWSVRGEPVELTIWPGTIAWYRDRPDLTYEWLDEEGHPVSEGSMDLTGEAVELRWTPPKAGRYRLKVNDSAAGWRWAVGPETPLVIELKAERLTHQSGHGPAMYFYVPKGTKEISYFWAGPPHEVWGPDRKLVREVTANGETVTIAVPRGHDGALWFFRKTVLGTLWFHNIPNVLSYSPRGMMLPREVVKADRLPTPVPQR